MKGDKMKKVKLIYNSGAGQSKFKYFLDTIIEKFMQNGCEVSVFRAAKKTNLYEYLKDCDSEGVYAIVVAGGDGTINRVVNVIMKNNIKITFSQCCHRIHIFFSHNLKCTVSRDSGY